MTHLNQKTNTTVVGLKGSNYNLILGTGLYSLSEIQPMHALWMPRPIPKSGRVTTTTSNTPTRTTQRLPPTMSPKLAHKRSGRQTTNNINI